MEPIVRLPDKTAYPIYRVLNDMPTIPVKGDIVKIGELSFLVTLVEWDFDNGQINLMTEENFRIERKGSSGE